MTLTPIQPSQSPQPIRPHVVIVSPALADANNGNWQTAQRWQKMLSVYFHCRIVPSWPDKFANQDEVMLALHARKSASSIAAWHAAKGASKLAVVLTGTDLYRDIETDAAAQASLAMAGQLIVLQELGPSHLHTHLQTKARVIFQSTTPLPTLAKPEEHLRVVMVGHLRSEKSSETLFETAKLLQQSDKIFIDHIGDGLDLQLAQQAQTTASQNPHYRWLGGLPHTATRRTVQRAHVLVHTSRMEGGAHVIMEAACSGTPVLASRIDGNVGMLGPDYEGYFDWGNPAQLVQLLRECRRTQVDANGLLAKLEAQIALRAPLFAPELEAASLHALVTQLI